MRRHLGRSSRLSLALTSVLFATIAVTGRSASAQENPPVRGIVKDSAGTPVPEVDVAIVSQHLLVRTNEKGEFVLPRVRSEPGEIHVSIRRLGFEPKLVRLNYPSDVEKPLQIVLTEHAQLLDGMEVAARDRRRMMAIEDFYRRRAHGSGMFISRDEIEATNSTKLSDVLRTLPGLRFDRSRGGSLLRFINSQSQRRDCVPQIWIDGIRVENMEIDDLPVHDVEGVELYAGPSTTPLQFAHFGGVTSCGTIAVWTRVPGT